MLDVIQAISTYILNIFIFVSDIDVDIYININVYIYKNININVFLFQHTWLAGGWLGKDSSGTATDSPQLTFSFQAQAQDKSSNALPAWQTAASTPQATDEASLLRQALSSFSSHAGLYLAPLLYRPTMQVNSLIVLLLSTGCCRPKDVVDSTVHSHS